MSKILQATPRGQVTIPKSWRDRVNTSAYESEILENNTIILRPLKTQDQFFEEVEQRWKEYKKGDDETFDLKALKKEITS